MSKWQYKKTRWESDSQISEIGQDGWELTFYDPQSWECIFRREIVEMHLPGPAGPLMEAICEYGHAQQEYGKFGVEDLEKPERNAAAQKCWDKFGRIREMLGDE